MELNLAGKTALITGSSRGIGFFIAQALSREGCRIAINGRDKCGLISALASLPGAIAIEGDVTQPQEALRIVREAKAALGQLNIVVCNVGGGRSVLPGCETYDEWQKVFALNLWSTTNIVEASREILRASKGVVICISSICGLETIVGAPITYSVAKSALHAYVRGISKPLGQEQVRIHAVAVGNMLFDGSVWAHKLADNERAVSDMLQRDVALGRLGKPEDVADLVTYLASDRSQFATGAVWTLDGGQVRA